MTEAPPQGSIEAVARRRAFFAAWAGAAVFLVLQDTTNAFSQARDMPRLNPREPFIWEYSSGLVVLALLPLIAGLVRRFPPGRDRWLRFSAIHLAASVGFCLLHVGGFVAIRKLIYALAGAHYGGGDLLYEYRKDLVTYLAFGLVFGLADWAARQWARNRADAPSGPRLYPLRDGGRLVRVPMADIVAVASARNYVEFHLTDGDKPLVRETLAKVQRDLACAGFLRTHRSWLVNPAHVRAVTPAAAGDFRLELAGGLTAPLSRRFPEALDALRSGGAA